MSGRDAGKHVRNRGIAETKEEKAGEGEAYKRL
jgi:hypothetical protein